MSLAPPIVIPGVPQSLEIPVQSLRRFTAEEYHRLIEDGYFVEDEAYELLEGLIVHKHKEPASPPRVVVNVGTATQPCEIPIELLRRFSVEEYHRLIDDGYFAADEAYELLEGLVVHKMTKKPDHWIAGELLRTAINALAIPGYFFHAQNPIATGYSEPEPDGALILGQLRDYVSGHPDPTKVPLVIEVADSSLSQDRTLKKHIYARARIPTYWIVNLIDRQVEVFTRPTGPADAPNYDDCQIVPADRELSVVIEGREVGRIGVRDLLP
jgi:Uma2 family endonuclease